MYVCMCPFHASPVTPSLYRYWLAAILAYRVNILTYIHLSLKWHTYILLPSLICFTTVNVMLYVRTETKYAHNKSVHVIYSYRCWCEKALRKRKENKFEVFLRLNVWCCEFLSFSRWSTWLAKAASVCSTKLQRRLLGKKMWIIKPSADWSLLTAI